MNFDGDQHLIDKRFAEIVSEPCDHDPLAPARGIVNALAITAPIALVAILMVWSIR